MLAKKPRTECGCHPVSCISAAIVAPPGDCSIAITRACLDESCSFSSNLIWVTARFGGLAIFARRELILDKRFISGFLGRFDIGISFGFGSIVRRHHRSPTSAIKPAGPHPGASLAPRTSDSTARFRAECQSFLDNLVA